MNSILKLSIAIGILAFVSLLLAVCLLPFAGLGTTFLPCFAFITMSSFVVKYFKNLLDRFIVSRQKEREYRAEIMAFLATKVKLPCQVCRKDNFVPINLNSETYFKCEHCESTHTVVVDFMPALVQKSEKADAIK